jgi:hypothetical protein
MVHMAFHDVNEGHGVAVIDPRGDVVADLLRYLPARHLDRIIYIDPGDPDWIPILDPLRCATGRATEHVAGEIACVICSLVTCFGDRPEHLLRHALLGILGLPDGTLFDVYNLFRSSAIESEWMRRRVLAVVEHPVTRLCWERDFLEYPLHHYRVPFLHILSKLLTNVMVCRMFSHPESRLDFRDMMDSGKILLVDLSSVGTEVGGILGSLVLSLFDLAILSRRDSDPSTYKPFHIFCDEADRVLAPPHWNLITQARKFNVSLTLAHQHLSQLDTRLADAANDVGTTIIFRVERADAARLVRDMRGLVEVDDLVSLKVGQAIARSDEDIVRIRTYPPLPVPQYNQAQTIIRQSHQRYYRPASVAP